MSADPVCPQCKSENTYPDRALLVCAECFHEWDPADAKGASVEGASAEAGGEKVVRDSAGTILQDGDTVTIVKSMKVKGSPIDLKVGTKVKGIRLIEPENGHDISCRIEGFGAMYLKSSIVRKA